MKRIAVISFFIYTFVLIIFSKSIYAETSGVTALNINVTHREGSMQVTGNIPKMQGLSNAIFTGKLNLAINKLYEDSLEQGKANKLKNISFAYELINSNNVVSVIIYKTEVSTTSISTVNTFVFNKITNKYVTITDILGANGIKIANTVISGKIAEDKGNAYFDFKQIDAGQSFYVKNGNIFVMFNEGVISNPSKGIVKFEISYNNIKNTIIGKGDYFNRTSYNIKMIPLRRVMGELGYNLAFDSARGEIKVSRGDTAAYVTVGSNIYKKGRFNKHLEMAPELINGVTYVPVSFFTEIVDVYFHVDSNGYITFSEYRENI